LACFVALLLLVPAPDGLGANHKAYFLVSGVLKEILVMISRKEGPLLVLTLLAILAFCNAELLHAEQNVKSTSRSDRKLRGSYAMETVEIKHAAISTKRDDRVDKSSESSPISPNATTKTDLFKSSPYKELVNHFATRHASQCPTNSTERPIQDWMTRFPKFSIIGAQKAGTKALRFLLHTHPDVAKSCGEHGMVELHYFDRIKPIPDVLDKRKLQQNYVDVISTKCHRSQKIVMEDDKKIFFDDSPKYLFDTHMVPQLYLCTIPWAKAVAVLRNPVDRAYSQYVFQHGLLCTGKTLEEWIEIDIATMTRVGLLKEGISIQEEYEAYKRYFESEEMTSDYRYCSFVGRGLYIIQILHWYAALDGFGIGRDNLMVIDSHNLKVRRQETYGKVLDFVGLNSHILPENTFEHKSDYASKPPLKESSRDRLQQFFQPYNQRLYDLLGWNSVWE
jgi:hypothetical protein